MGPPSEAVTGHGASAVIFLSGWGAMMKNFEIKLDLIRISFVCRVKVHDVYLGHSLRSGPVVSSEGDIAGE